MLIFYLGYVLEAIVCVFELAISINLQSSKILSFSYVFTGCEKKAFLGACVNLYVTLDNSGFHFNISNLHNRNFVSDDMLYQYHTKQNKSSCNIKTVDGKRKIKCQFSRKLINDRFLASIKINHVGLRNTRKNHA